MKFGERLKQARTEKGLTQEIVATELFVSRQTISSWENERSYPDINSLVQLSNYYQLSLDILLKEDNGMVEEMKRKEELAKTNKIWGLSYCMNLVFLLILLLSLFTKNSNFSMGTGIRVGVLVVMFLNVGLLMYITTEKNRLSQSKKASCSNFSKIFKLFLGVVAFSFSAGLVLLYLKYDYASHILGMATGVLATTTCFYVMNKFMARTKK